MTVCRYGFELQKKAILISDVRVRGIGSTNILRPVVLNKAVGEPEAEKQCRKVYFGTGWHDTLVCFFLGSCFVWLCSHVLAVMSYIWQ
jgi:N-methylhydantoinase A/oxoprolinase/acetone carboxylase beta subunit